MTTIRNISSLKGRRRELRRNQTEAEKLLWSRLRNKQFYGMKFFRQYGVGGYILDFCCPKLGLAVELDGGQHAEEENLKYDEVRSDFLRAHGIEVMRFWNNEVLQNIDGVLQRMAENSPCPLFIKEGE